MSSHINRIKDSHLPTGILVVVGLMVANCCLAVLWPSAFTGIAALILVATLALCMFSANPGGSMLMLPSIVGYISGLASMIAIEAGGYMKEIGWRGAESPASAMFALFGALFLLTALTTHVRLTQWRPLKPCTSATVAERSFILAWGAVLVVGLVVIYLAMSGLRNGFPLLTGTDRFEYRRLSADVLTLNFLNLKFLFSAILGTGAAFTASRLQRNSHHLTFFAYVLVSFLFGDKFFIILTAAIYYSMPFLLKNPKQIGKNILRLTPIALLIVISVFGVTLFIYSGYGQLSTEATLIKIGERVAGQGQLWYIAVKDESAWFAFDSKIVLLNFQNLFANPAADFAFHHRLAAFYFVERYSPTEMYHSYLTNAGTVTPSAAFEAYALVAFGYVGLIISLIAAGIVTGLIVTWLAKSFMTGNPFNALLPAYVCTSMGSVMAQGTLYSLLGVSAFKAYAAFLTVQLIVAELVKSRRAAQALAA